jgi:hypothetical protein
MSTVTEAVPRYIHVCSFHEVPVVCDLTMNGPKYRYKIFGDVCDLLV